MFVETLLLPNEDDNYCKTTIKGLIQNTQYAYYVKTQNTQHDHNTDVLNDIQGQSNIMYFKTIANVPESPMVETMSKTHDSITLSWAPLSSSRDQISYYRMHMFAQLDSPDFLDARDYCLEPRTSTHQHATTNYEVKTESVQSTQSCTAEYKEWTSRHGLSVESELEWRAYRKTLCGQIQLAQPSKPTDNRKYYCRADDKDCVSEYVIDDSFQFNRVLEDLVRSSGDAETNEQIQRAAIQSDYIQEFFYDSTQYSATISDLLPFTLYVFQFRSCNDRGCSPYYMHFERTESNQHADDIVDFNASVDPYETDTIHLDFSQPIIPNGLTVAYEIDQRSIHEKKTNLICITRRNHFNNGQR